MFSPGRDCEKNWNGCARENLLDEWQEGVSWNKESHPLSTEGINHWSTEAMGMRWKKMKIISSSPTYCKGLQYTDSYQRHIMAILHLQLLRLMLQTNFSLFAASTLYVHHFGGSPLLIQQVDSVEIFPSDLQVSKEALRMNSKCSGERPS